MGKEGGTVGPELGSIGSKYPRDELIASVLTPSAKISSGYEPEVLALADGRVFTGIVRGETADAVEVQDADAKLVKELKSLAADSEEFAANGREFYAWHPEGVARSKLWNKLAGKGLGVTATARNWTTVTTLLEMADE